MIRSLLAVAILSSVACSHSRRPRDTDPTMSRTLLTPPAGNGRDSLNADALPGNLQAVIPVPANTISLTYDDGPGADTLAIAQLLHDHGIHATFFMVGCNFKHAPSPDSRSTLCRPGPRYDDDLIARIEALGHRVGNHTEDHLHLDQLADSGDGTSVTSQIESMQARLAPYIADGLSVFRAPYHGWDAEATKSALGDAALGSIVGSVGYDINGGDYACTCVDLQPEQCAALGIPTARLTPAQCAARYLSSANARPLHNGIVQLHDRLEFNLKTDYALELTERLLALLPRGSGPGHFLYVPLDAFPGIITSATFKTPSIWSTWFSDASWQSRSSYETLHLVDVNGDGAADVCGRRYDGVWCALSNDAGFETPVQWFDAGFTDATGWGPEQYGSTVQFGDIDGDGRADVCGRGRGGVWCAVSTGARFGQYRIWSPGFSDRDGWASAESYYGSIRLADVNGDGRADVCGRSAAGISCALSTGARFGPVQSWRSDDFADPAGWRPPQYGTTISFADVDGDGKADVCGRKSTGIVCSLSTGTSFGPAAQWTEFDAEFSDDDGWATASKYRSIHLADVNGDGKADVCGRNATGVVCSYSNGSMFTGYRYMRNTEFTDAIVVNGALAPRWSQAQYGSTVQLGDVNHDGKADVCGRFGAGIMCALAP